MKKRKLYVVNGGAHDAKWILPLGFELTNNIDEAELVLGTGGSDWSPKYYGEQEHPFVSTNPSRDIYEFELFNQVIKKGIPFVGVCRSSQGASVLSGGKLVQHMRHPVYHYIKTFDGQEFDLISTHHNLQWPFNLPPDDYKIIGWAENLSPYHEGGDQEEMDTPVEPEIVYYKKTNMLGIQTHPECMLLDDPAVIYCQNLVNKLIEGSLTDYCFDRAIIAV